MTELVKIKPLEWRDAFGTQVASSVFGFYAIADLGVEHVARFRGKEISRHPSSEDAKMAGQAHHDGLIRSAIDDGEAAAEIDLLRSLVARNYGVAQGRAVCLVSRDGERVTDIYDISADRMPEGYSFAEEIEGAEEENARLNSLISRYEEALRNLATEMRHMLRMNPSKDGGLYRQRLTEAEALLARPAAGAHGSCGASRGMDDRAEAAGAGAGRGAADAQPDRRGTGTAR